jgi:hypothetical protein
MSSFLTGALHTGKEKENENEKERLNSLSALLYCWLLL